MTAATPRDEATLTKAEIVRRNTTAFRDALDSAYMDKLDGKIPDDFWERKMTEWRAEEQQVKLALDGLASSENTDRALDAQRMFELANKAYLLYFSQDFTEKAKLLKMMCSNLSVDAVSVTPTYRYPFDIIFKRAKLQEWSSLVDDFELFAGQNIFPTS